MSFSEQDKYTIKVLRQHKLYGAKRLLKMSVNKKKLVLNGMKQSLLSKSNATGNIDVVQAVVGHTQLEFLTLNSCLQEYILHIQKILVVEESTIPIVLAG